MKKQENRGDTRGKVRRRTNTDGEREPEKKKQGADHEQKQKKQGTHRRRRRKREGPRKTGETEREWNRKHKPEKIKTGGSNKKARKLKR